MDKEKTWVRAAALTDLEVGDMLGVEVGERKIALYRVDEQQLYATGNVCTHGQALLTDGWLDGEIVECPLHGGCFNVRDGKGVCAPITTDLIAYPVKVEDDEVFIGL